MKQWFVVQSKPKQETTAELNLGRQGYETYCPRCVISILNSCCTLGLRAFGNSIPEYEMLIPKRSITLKMTWMHPLEGLGIPARLLKKPSQ